MNAFRWLGITVAVVVGLIAVALGIGSWWLNNYIHSDAFRQEVQARASQSLGGVVQIETIDFGFFSGVKLHGLVTQLDPAHAGGVGALQVQVADVNCSYSWMELLNRRLRLTGVTLDKPQIVLTKQATAPLAPASSTTTSPSDTSANSATPGKSAPFQFILDRAKINDGTVSVRDAGGTSMVDLGGLNITANTAGYTEDKDVTGTLKVATISLPSNLQVTDFSTPFTYRTGSVEAKSFDASAFGGKLTGDYQLAAGPSVLDLNAKGLDMTKVSTAAMANSSARLTGTLDLQSKWRGVEAGDLNGEGDLQLANSQLEGVKILHSVSQILKIKELDQPIIKSGQSHFVVAGRQARLTGLQLDATVFRLTGDGTVDFNGSLNLNLVLILTADTMAKLPKEFAASFVVAQDGSGSISFQVTGTDDNPQTNLPTRLLMQNTRIKNVIDKALNKFFH